MTTELRPTTAVFIATSLDGFIARENGDIDWLPADPDNTEDYGYAAFMNSVDALVMGRNTFEKVLTFGEWPYQKKPVIVLSHRPLDIPASLADCVESMSGEPADILARLSARGYRHLYLDGGITIQRFLAAGLVHRIILTRIPILSGRGIPLFGPLPHDLALRHTGTRSYPNGIVQSEYEIA